MIWPKDIQEERGGTNKKMDGIGPVRLKRPWENSPRRRRKFGGGSFGCVTKVRKNRNFFLERKMEAGKTVKF